MPRPSQPQVPQELPAVLMLIQDEFWECVCPIRGDRITCDSLARRWGALAELTCEYGLGQPAKQAIALRSLQQIWDMDLTQKDWVSMDEWTHHGLLVETGGTADLVKDELSQAMQTNPESLKSVLHVFSSADTLGSGSISFGDLVALYNSSLFSSNGAKLPAAKLLTRLKLLKPEHEANTFAHNFLLAVGPYNDDLDTASARVSYTQFIAHCVGRDHSEVTLHLYDLSMGTAPKISPWLLGRHVEGIWHTGVVAFGHEFYFTHDCGFDDPGSTRFGAPTRVIRLGHTLRTQPDLHKYIVDEMKPVFHRDTYDVVNHNCNHFADRVCMFLGGLRLPEDVLQQPEYLLVSGAVRFAKPLMNWYLRDNVASRDPTPDAGTDGAEISQRSEPLMNWSLPPPGSAVLVRPVAGRCAPVLGVACAEVPASSAEGRSAPSMLVSYLDAGPTLFGSSRSFVVRTEVVGAYRLVSEGLEATLLDVGYRAALSVLTPNISQQTVVSARGTPRTYTV